MDDSSDETLVARTRQGDHQAFAVLLDRYRLVISLSRSGH